MGEGGREGGREEKWMGEGGREGGRGEVNLSCCCRCLECAAEELCGGGGGGSDCGGGGGGGESDGGGGGGGGSDCGGGGGESDSGGGGRDECKSQQVQVITTCTSCQVLLSHLLPPPSSAWLWLCWPSCPLPMDTGEKPSSC